MTAPLSIIPIAGIGEIRPGDELAELIADAARAQGTPLADGDCVVVTQKIVSKAEGRLVPIDPLDRDALVARRERVIGISPIVGGAPVKGPADRLMAPLGIEVSCVGVARAYREICGALVIDAVDERLAPDVEAAGVRAIVTDTMMRSPEIATQLARQTLAAVA